MFPFPESNQTGYFYLENRSKMISYTTSKNKDELLGILRLQKANLPDVLTTEEIQSQGFVTVSHSYEELKKLNDIEQHLIGKEGNNVMAYLLAMTERSKMDIPVLRPMFETFGKILYKGIPVSEYNYIVVGQVCVEKNFRGMGILDKCYAAYRDHFINKYDLAITEIDAKNLRSLNAHKRIGFTEIHRYMTPNNIEWVIVIWDWHKGI